MEGADKKRKDGFKMTMQQFVHYMQFQVRAGMVCCIVSLSEALFLLSFSHGMCDCVCMHVCDCVWDLQRDETPLYIFERKFAEIAPVLREHYDPAALKVRTHRCIGTCVLAPNPDIPPQRVSTSVARVRSAGEQLRLSWCIVLFPLA